MKARQSGAVSANGAVIGRRAFLALGGAAVAARAAARPKVAAADFTGYWTNASGTPLERPAAFKTLTLSAADARAYEAREGRIVRGVPGDDVGQDSAEWFGPAPPLLRIGGQARTSWIVDPADGRLPYSPAGRAALGRELRLIGNFDEPEVRPTAERCLLGFGTPADAPLLYTPQTNGAYEFVQTPDGLAIRAESNHDLRIVTFSGGLDGPALRPWMGVSRGGWDGATLVVETEGFNRGEGLRSLPFLLYLSADAKVTERFTHTGPGEMLYEFAVDDPAVFTRPWRGELMFRRLAAPIYEYACHEGNYSLTNILAGARREDAEKRGR